MTEGATGGETVICRCEEVTVREIQEAIEDGARTLDGIKKRTRAGMGLCQGKTCGRLVARILEREAGVPAESIVPVTVRPPVRPIRIGAWERGGE